MEPVIEYSDTPTVDSLVLDDHVGAVSDVLFLSIGEGAIVIDGRGTIARVNQIAADMLGYNIEELLGKWYPETVIAEEESGRAIPNLERPITEMFLTAKPVYKRMYFRRKDGGRVPVALTVSPVMLDEKPIGAIEIFRDITDEIQLEHAKDEFISIASHQLRTPATVVKQYLGMILDGYAASGEAQLNMIRTAYEHNNNQLAIINDLLKVAQIEANSLTANPQEINVCELVRSIIDEQRPEFKKRDIAIQLSLPQKQVCIYIDPLHLRMMLENLITNANKYSLPGGKVTVKAEVQAGLVMVSVSDQGIGIDQKDIPRLFSKFSRIDNAKSIASGTGLGLYWAKKLVELYNGEIRITSQLHQGSTFTVCLPEQECP